jgi:hypothetical protein
MTANNGHFLQASAFDEMKRVWSDSRQDPCTPERKCRMRLQVMVLLVWYHAKGDNVA